MCRVLEEALKTLVLTLKPHCVVANTECVRMISEELMISQHGTGH